MNIAKLKTFPFHFLLLPLFFVWHVCNAYFGLIPFRYSSKYLLYYTGLAVVLFIIGKLFFRNNTKAGIWSTLLMIPFFFWGAMHDFIRISKVPVFFSSYTFLLPSTLLFIIAFTYWLHRKKRKLTSTNVFFNTLFSLFLAIELSITTYKLSTKEIAKNDIAINNQSLKTSSIQVPDSLKPDIFFIIFDEYASSISLKKYLQFNNSDLDSFLHQKNFFLAKKSKSNYKLTPYSVSSTLNLDYHNVDIEGKILDAKGELKAQYTLYKSWLLPFLKTQGYQIKNIGVFDIEAFPAPFESHFNKLIPRLFYTETLYGRIEKEVWWVIENKVSKKNNPSRYGLNNEEVFKTIQGLSEIKKELADFEREPKFVISHLLIPHSPYYFDSKGDLRTPSSKDHIFSDSLYLDQVRFINKQIKEIAELANLKSNRPRVIIIEGDHGKKDMYKNNKSFIREKQFMNLNAYFFSDKEYNQLYDSISPVNTFRAILNKYFSANLPFLKDSTILHH